MKGVERRVAGWTIKRNSMMDVLHDFDSFMYTHTRMSTKPSTPACHMYKLGR